MGVAPSVLELELGLQHRQSQEMGAGSGSGWVPSLQLCISNTLSQ